MKSTYKAALNKVSFIAVFVMCFILFWGFTLRNSVFFASSSNTSYITMGQQLAQNGVYAYESTQSNAAVVPAYPVLLSMIFKTPGANIDAKINTIKILQLLFSVSAIVFIYLAAKNTFDKIAGIVAALFITFYPAFVYSWTELVPTTIFTAVFLFYLAIQLKAIQDSSIVYSMLSGFLFGLVVLLNPSCIIIGLIPLIYNSIKFHNGFSLKFIGMFLGGFLIPLIPWWIRNIITLKQFIFLSTSFSNEVAIFGQSISNMVASPIDYFNNIISPRFFAIIAHPVSLNQPFAYLHYIIITLAALGALYSLKDERIRIITIMAIIAILQVIFVTGGVTATQTSEVLYLFPLLIIIAGYMINRVVNDVFNI